VREGFPPQRQLEGFHCGVRTRGSPHRSHLPTSSSVAPVITCGIIQSARTVLGQRLTAVLIEQVVIGAGLDDARCGQLRA
jgi:hypothetical protein